MSTTTTTAAAAKIIFLVMFAELDIVGRLFLLADNIWWATLHVEENPYLSVQGV